MTRRWKKATKNIIRKMLVLRRDKGMSVEDYREVVNKIYRFSPRLSLMTCSETHDNSCPGSSHSYRYLDKENEVGTAAFCLCSYTELRVPQLTGAIPA